MDQKAKTIILSKGNDASATLKIGDQNPSDYLGWNEVVACYKRASDRIDRFFEYGKENAIDSELEFYLYEGSSYWVRFDGLAGPILWLYLSEVLKSAIKRYQIETIRLDAKVPECFLRFCKEHLGLEQIDETHEKVVLKWKSYAKHKLKSPYNIVKVALVTITVSLRNIRRKNANISKSKRKVLLVFLRGWSNHRYGGLISQLKNDYKVIGVYPKEFINKFRGQYEEGIISNCQHINLLMALKVFYNSIRLLKIQRKKEDRKQIYDYFQTSLLRQSFEEIFKVILQTEAYKKMIEHYKPLSIIESGSYNSPNARRICKACKEMKVKSINIMQKAVIGSQVYFKFNWEEKNQSLPNYFIVHQLSSKKTIQSWGVPESNIYVGYRGAGLCYDTSEELVKIDQKTLKHNEKLKLLVLLHNNSTVNERIIVDALSVAEKNDLNILVRQHPNLQLKDQKRILELLDDIRWEDVSNKAWNDFVIYGNTITITPVSSASVEAISYGSVLLWIPYCSDIAVVQNDLIDTIGTVCQSSIELAEKIKLFTDKDARFKELEKQKYQLENELSLPSGDLIEAVYKCLEG